ncbi:MAG: hypothetical protein WCI05_10610 [Myxococcales bacterium]|jgi:hypothetical protein
MTTSLRNTLVRLADAFAVSVLEAVRASSLDEILSETQPGGPRAIEPEPVTEPLTATTTGDERLGRRSQRAISSLLDRIVTLLEENPDGLRSEQIRVRLGLSAKELPRPLAQALESGQVIKSGQKRATTYKLSELKVAPTTELDDAELAEVPE